MAEGWSGRRRLIAALTCGCAAALILVPAVPASACTRIGGITIGECRPPTETSTKKASPEPASVLLGLLNGEREAVGLRGLRVDPRARRMAEKHAQRMAARGSIYHNPRLKTNAGRQQLGYPARLGENVGVGPTARAVHTAFTQSERHARNILYPGFTHVGIGTYHSDGSLWVVQVFLTRSSVGSAIEWGSRLPDPQPGIIPPGSAPGAWGSIGSRPIHEALVLAVRAPGPGSGDGRTGDGSFAVGLAATSLVTGVSLAARRRRQTARTSA